MGDDRTAERAAFARYVEADDEIKNLNQQINLARDRRSTAEQEVAVMLRQQRNVALNQVSFGNSMFEVKREGQWSTPWSLSKSTFLRYAALYQRDSPNPTVDGFVAYITAAYGQTRVSNRLMLIRKIKE
jgi:hypothetical protein